VEATAVKKPIVIGIAAFIVALAAATGLGMILRKAPDEAASSDRSHTAQEEQADAGGPFRLPPVVETTMEQGGSPGADSAGPQLEPITAPADPTDQGPDSADAPAGSSSAATAIQESAPSGSEDGETPTTAATVKPQYRQFAKIMASMKAARAAEIMAYLSDEQAEMILRSLGVRQVAELLAAMPVERAAALSKRLLEHPTEEE
jgi:hypothetical protein